jgi:hypothetical protein
MTVRLQEVVVSSKVDRAPAHHLFPANQDNTAVPKAKERRNGDLAYGVHGPLSSTATARAV